MKYQTQIKQGKFTEYWEDMVQDNWELVYFSEQHLTSFWKKKITAKKTTKNLEDTILYKENLELYKKWTPKLREAYKTFRQERYAQHKDFVSHWAEKLLMNKINKYSESISIKLMQASASYKSIVEHEDIISEGRTQQQIEERRLEEERKMKEQQEVLDKRKQQNKAIQDSWKPYEYWEERALKELKEQYPNYSEQMLRGQLNPRIRTILTRENLLW